jgi:hypothetical protein
MFFLPVFLTFYSLGKLFADDSYAQSTFSNLNYTFFMSLNSSARVQAIVCIIISQKLMFEKNKHFCDFV